MLTSKPARIDPNATPERTARVAQAAIDVLWANLGQLDRQLSAQSASLQSATVPAHTHLHGVTQNYIPKSANGTDAWADSVMMESAGNIGINKAPTLATLDINGSIAVGSNANRYLTSNGVGSLLQYFASGDLYSWEIATLLSSGSWGASGGGFEFQPRGTQAFRIGAAGGVYVGSVAFTEPGSGNLDVAGLYRASTLQNVSVTGDQNLTPTSSMVALSPSVTCPSYQVTLAAGTSGDIAILTNIGSDDVEVITSIGTRTLEINESALVYRAGANWYMLDRSHDSLSGYVANEHISHSLVSILAGSGLTGGGDLVTSRTISLANHGVTLNYVPKSNGSNGWTDSPLYYLGAGAVAIKGSATDNTNDSYLSFRLSNGTEVGYVGDVDSGNQNIVLKAATGNVVLRNASGDLLTCGTAGTFVNTAGGSYPFYVTRLGGADQGLQVYATDRALYMSYIEDAGEVSPGVWHFISSLAGGASYEWMTVNADGTVGINTTSGAARLSVNGGVHIGGTTDPGDDNLLVDGTATVSTIAALGTAATVFLTHSTGLIQSRTAAQVLSDIGAAPLAHGVTTNALPRASGASTWADSGLSDNGSVITSSRIQLTVSTNDVSGSTVDANAANTSSSALVRTINDLSYVTLIGTHGAMVGGTTCGLSYAGLGRLYSTAAALLVGIDGDRAVTIGANNLAVATFNATNITLNRYGAGVLQTNASGVISASTITSASVSDFTEAAQDAVGGALTNSSSITFTYTDASNQITAAVEPSGVDHGGLAGLGDDDHSQYILASGTRAFSGVVSGITPTSSSHLATKGYVDSAVSGNQWLEPVLDKDLSSPPGAPTSGDRYFVNGTGSGAWSGHDNDVAEYNGSGWDFTDLSTGNCFLVTDEGIQYLWNGSALIQISSSDHGSLSGLSDDDHPQYVLANATRGMSADWDIGNYTLRAKALQSDVATGTAPLIIASTTAVTNLNSDFLDSQHGSYYLDRGNHTGTQTSSTISDFTEAAQDAVGGILTDSTTIDFTYTDASNQITAAVLPGGVDHNSLLNYSANRHIDHTAVTLTAGSGLTGGGDISTNRTFAVGAGTGISVGVDSVSLSHLGIESLTDPGADRVMFWDESANAAKWLTVSTGLSIADTTLTCTITQYTDEMAQDAVGGILTDSTTIDFTYTDASNQITATLIADSVADTHLRNSAACSVIGRSANSTGDPGDISASTNGHYLRRSSDTLAFGAIAAADLPNHGVTTNYLPKSNGSNGWSTSTITDSGTAVTVNAGSADVDFIINRSSAEAFRIDGASGNFGLGTSDIESWNAAYGAMNLGSVPAIMWNKTGSNVYLLSNAFYSSEWKYRTTDVAAAFLLNDGYHEWRVAASGTADAALTWTNAMRLTNDGFLGINCVDPAVRVEVSQDNSSTGLLLSTFSDTPQQTGYLMLYHARGTRSAPTATQSGDELGSVYFVGYDTARSYGARMVGIAAGGWGTSSDGSDDPTDIAFETCADGSGSLVERMRICSTGNIGVGCIDPAFLFEVSTDGTSSIGISRFSDTATNMPYLVLYHARGTRSAPTATQAGDQLGAIYFQGYDTSRSSGARMIGIAAAEWGTGGTPDSTDSPTDIAFETTADGSGTLVERMRICSTGNTGFGCVDPATLVELSKDGASPGLLISGYSDTSTVNGYLALYHARGSRSSPTATQAGDYVGSVHFQGFDTVRSTGAVIRGVAAAEWGTGGDDSDRPTDVVVLTCGDSSSTLVERMRVASTGFVSIGSHGSASALLDLQQSGTAKAVTDFLELTNSRNALDMDGTGTGILFNQFYYHATTPAVFGAGRISVKCNSDATSDVGSQYTTMVFAVNDAGTITNQVEINNNYTLFRNDIGLYHSSAGTYYLEITGALSDYRLELNSNNNNIDTTINGDDVAAFMVDANLNCAQFPSRVALTGVAAYSGAAYNGGTSASPTALPVNLYSTIRVNPSADTTNQYYLLDDGTSWQMVVVVNENTGSRDAIIETYAGNRHIPPDGIAFFQFIPNIGSGTGEWSSTVPVTP